MTKIFVEGVADQKFLHDYISVTFNTDLSKEDIIISKGWGNIKSKKGGELIKNAMQKNSDNNGNNLVIFDADNDYGGRLTEINDWKQANRLDFEIFLLPNNKDVGDLETVLENIINPTNKPIFACWDNYEACLKAQKIEGRTEKLTIPAKKTKIYGYLEALLGESRRQKEQIKELHRDYRNKEHWNLDADYLDAIKCFLSRYFVVSPSSDLRI